MLLASREVEFFPKGSIVAGIRLALCGVLFRQ
jgi:hypothetical protein